MFSMAREPVGARDSGSYSRSKCWLSLLATCRLLSSKPPELDAPFSGHVACIRAVPLHSVGPRSLARCSKGMKKGQAHRHMHRKAGTWWNMLILMEEIQHLRNYLLNS